MSVPVTCIVQATAEIYVLNVSTASTGSLFQNPTPLKI